MANLQFAQSQLKQSLEDQPDREPDEEYAAATRQIGTTKEVDGETKYWSGQNYGWQSKASYDKLEKEYEFNFGTIARKRVQQSAGTFLQENTPEQIKEAGRMVVRNGKAVYDASPEWLQETLKLTGQAIDYAGQVVGEEAAEAFGIDPFLGEISVDLATGLGAAKGTKYAVKGGALHIAKNIDAPPVQALTITDPDFIAAGVKQGIASEPGFAEWFQQWTARRNELQERMRNPEGVTPKRQQANLKRARETAYNDVSTGPSRFTDDPEAYGIKQYKELGKQQHHLFPKQESYQFVERMRAIGDDDDVINLFLYAEELDAAMGGRLSNMLNMSTQPHSKLHANRIKDGRQLQAMQMKNLVESAKTTDELMKLFDKYIVENIRPSKAEAKQLQETFKQTKLKMKEANKLEATLSEVDRRRL